MMPPPRVLFHNRGLGLRRPSSRSFGQLRASSSGLVPYEFLTAAAMKADTGTVGVIVKQTNVTSPVLSISALIAFSVAIVSSAFLLALGLAY